MNSIKGKFVDKIKKQMHFMCIKYGKELYSYVKDKQIKQMMPKKKINLITKELKKYFDFDNMVAIKPLSLDEIIYCIALLTKISAEQKTIDRFLLLVGKLNKKENPISCYGDLLIYDKEIDKAVEVSSMGIRVDELSLLSQLEKSDTMDRIELPYHQKILKKQLPYTIGGGIGQSRLLMLILGSQHIAEVQASSWEDKALQQLEDLKIL